MGIFFGILTMRIVISFGVIKNMAGKSPINGGFVRWEHHRTSHAGFPTSHGTDYQRVLRLERQTSFCPGMARETPSDKWITGHVAKQSTPNWFLPAQQHVVSYFG